MTDYIDDLLEGWHETECALDGGPWFEQYQEILEKEALEIDSEK